MCHVLVIEDDWLLAEQLAELARGAGALSIETADTQQGAIEAARNRAPGIILSDVKLAAGTGPRAVQAIHSALGSIPVIFITGTPEECEPCNPPGIILDKPVQEEVLLDAFRRMAPL